MWKACAKTGVVVTLCLLTACPWDSTEAPSPGEPRDEGLAYPGGVAGAAAAAALEDAIASANRVRFPPAPNEETLCKLKVAWTEYDEAKKLLGAPQTETMEATHASMAFRFSVPKDAAKEDLTADSHELGIAINLAFVWKDACDTCSFGFEELNKQMGYILNEVSISGRVYPPCWPHHEPGE